MMMEQRAHVTICNHLGLPGYSNIDMTVWKRDLADRWDNHIDTVQIAVIGKYTNLSDAYLSVIKALQHACLAVRRKLELVWVEAGDIEPEVRPYSLIHEGPVDSVWGLRFCWMLGPNVKDATLRMPCTGNVLCCVLPSLRVSTETKVSTALRACFRQLRWTHTRWTPHPCCLTDEGSGRGLPSSGLGDDTCGTWSSNPWRVRKAWRGRQDSGCAVLSHQQETLPGNLPGHAGVCNLVSCTLATGSVNCGA